MKHLLAQWRHMFDHIIIDTAPILAVTDAVRLSVEADAVLLVIRSSQTTKAALRRASVLLAQVKAHVLGIVVNALDLRSPDHSDYYYAGTKYAASYYTSEETEKASARPA
jgi:Mrp family chromosome partitioning ATPase